jgi:hypothetical protein
MRKEYDLSKLAGGVHGKYCRRGTTGTNLVLIGPDLASVFSDSEAVNRAAEASVSVAPGDVLCLVLCLRPERESRFYSASRPSWPATSLQVGDDPRGTRKSHLRRARMSNSGLSNRHVRSLPKKMTLSA